MMRRPTDLALFPCLVLLLASISSLSQDKPAPAAAPDSKSPAKQMKAGVMKTDQNGVRRFVSAEAAQNALPQGIPPASCDEWATQSPPSRPVGTKCKRLGGTDLCSRVTGIHAGTYDIGPIVGQQQVGKPLTIHFRIRDFGSGDAVIYAFGKVDWGDNSQQDIMPFGFDVALTHTYASQRDYVIHAMGGAQFKYQGGPISGSYEGCVDNSIPVKITP
jgi:hypothetical protein